MKRFPRNTDVIKVIGKKKGGPREGGGELTKTDIGVPATKKSVKGGATTWGG